MKKENGATHMFAKQIATKMIRKDAEGWPPSCVVFTFQPMRPYKQDEVAPSSVHHNRKGEKETI